MKPIISDNRTSYVHYIGDTIDIFGTYHKINKPLASIKDVENHHEIWDCPLVVREGTYRYDGNGYVPVEMN